MVQTICGAKNRDQLLKTKTIAEELGLVENKDFFLCYTSFCSKVKVLCCIIENCYNVMVLSIFLISFSVFRLLPIYNR